MHELFDRVEIPFVVFAKERIFQRFKLIDRQTRAGINLTGKIVRLTVREDIDSPSFVFQKATTTGIVHADQGTNPGEFDLTIDAADNDLPLTEHVWDLWVDDEVFVIPSPYPVRRSVRQP